MARLNELVQPFQWKARLKSGPPVEKRAGWVPPPLLGDFSAEIDPEYWDFSSFHTDRGYSLRVLVEKRKVSGEYLQLHLKERLGELYKERGELPSRAEQKAIREEVGEELMRRTVPAISYIDALWSHDNEILLASCGASARQSFEELFSATFAKPLGGYLVLMTPILTVLPHPAKASEMDFERLAGLLPMPRILNTEE